MELQVIPWKVHTILEAQEGGRDSQTTCRSPFERFFDVFALRFGFDFAHSVV